MFASCATHYKIAVQAPARPQTYDYDTPVCKETCGLCPEPVAPEPVAPEPACVDEDTTGNTAWEELKTTAESVGVKADSCADLAKYCDNAKYGAMIGAVCHASCGTCR